ncbi:hypothetical protein GCM10007416_33880 [Kroppenstedtia guangzhouensis]|uniref:Uncharacterized protein n=1 Tax=Kroppenstedtia guangzhouensis TaxID=1274356 RepID=A0ABQ1H426_9BACL|nr:hypothetical protein [Kroppenstedtia guangzhouensis]GGA57903.1 hypothetical protein GCM10007416_33880 [Kroppenstedtia guangzhouensis]
MEWYHEWQQKARNRYQDGYYPKHKRMPNFIVRFLYGIGYFLGDFVPLTLNLLEGIYRTIQRLLAFIAELLIDASTGIVLVGSIVFSITHSIELLRAWGATDGLEYIGVLMFEVVFISATATLTKMLMKGKTPSFKNFGFVFSISGFTMGILFVFWSNISGMADGWGGTVIGGATPILLIISEGLIAYRYMDETEDESKMMELIQRNQLSIGDVTKALEIYLSNQRKMELESQKISSNREEEKFEESPLENLESGDLENPPTENRETGDLENPPAENLETSKLETSRLEEKKLENQESLETGELETSRQKLTESITSWKLENLPPRVENRAKPTSLKVSTLEGEKLEDQKLEDQKLEAGELEKPESGDLENLETSKLEEFATGEMETSSLEDLEVETGEQIGELEEKLETPKLEAGESSSVENLETGESSNLENQKQETSKVEKVEKEEKFTKEDLEHFSREELEAMKGADPEDVAVRILEREGELPGRPRLKRLTGCTEWDARKTLRELKKELNAS